MHTQRLKQQTQRLYWFEPGTLNIYYNIQCSSMRLLRVWVSKTCASLGFFPSYCSALSKFSVVVYFSVVLTYFIVFILSFDITLKIVFFFFLMEDRKTGSGQERRWNKTGKNKGKITCSKGILQRKIFFSQLKCTFSF